MAGRGGRAGRPGEDPREDLAAVAAAAVRRHGAAGGGAAARIAAHAEALEAPHVVRVVGGAGVGAESIPPLLEDLEGVRCEVVDIDGPLPRVAPDVEVFAWCTAPCAHELRWLRRPRRHPAIVVATRTDCRPPGVRPGWSVGLPTADGPEGRAAVRALVRTALREAPALRIATVLARLDRDCTGWSTRDATERLAAELHGLLADAVAAAASPTDGTGETVLGETVLDEKGAGA